MPDDRYDIQSQGNQVGKKPSYTMRCFSDSLLGGGVASEPCSFSQQLLPLCFHQYIKTRKSR